MAAKIELDQRVLGEIRNAAARAALKTMEAVKTDIVASKTMPFNMGTMQGTLATDQFQEGENTHTALSTDTAYARRLYYHPEYDFQQEGKNENAGAYWYKPYEEGGEKNGFVRETFAAALREELPK